MAWARLRILLAEDDELVGTVYSDMLSDAGHEVRWGRDGIEALELASQGAFDIMLSDLDMPRMNGYELYRRMRALLPGLPIVLMTGKPPHDGLSAFHDSATAPVTLLEKPTRFPALMQALESMHAAACARPA